MNHQPALCAAIKTSGASCHMNALKGGRYCFYHQRDRQRTRLNTQAARQAMYDQENPSPYAPKPRPIDAAQADLALRLNLPSFDDALAVQTALTAVFRASFSGQLTPKQANSLLYNCQLAMANLKHIAAEFEAAKNDDRAATIDSEPIYSFDGSGDREIPDEQRQQDNYSERVDPAVRKLEDVHRPLTDLEREDAARFKIRDEQRARDGYNQRDEELAS
jgi:hypothetical protein